MKSRIALGTILFVVLVFTPFVRDAEAGMFRLTMNDGTSVDVPYYWEEGGDIKFQVAGGVAGFPKGQVASIQEVVTGGEFDPQVLLESTAEVPKGSEDRRKLEDLIISRPSGGATDEKLSPEESRQLLSSIEAKRKQTGAAGGRVYTPVYRIEEEFAELVRPRGGEVMLVIKEVLSSRDDLRNQGFTASFFDGEGKLLQQKACEVQELSVDKKAMRKMGMRGRLFAVTASVKPDPIIKRYEISASY
ncbi:MAG: hypothetical protein AB2L11_02975 [Syntrophobacteraceae bacterium]